MFQFCLPISFKTHLNLNTQVLPLSSLVSICKLPKLNCPLHVLMRFFLHLKKNFTDFPNSLDINVFHMVGMKSGLLTISLNQCWVGLDVSLDGLLLITNFSPFFLTQVHVY